MQECNVCKKKILSLFQSTSLDREEAKEKGGLRSRGFCCPPISTNLHAAKDSNRFLGSYHWILNGLQISLMKHKLCSKDEWLNGSLINMHKMNGWMVRIVEPCDFNTLPNMLLFIATVTQRTPYQGNYSLINSLIRMHEG